MLRQLVLGCAGLAVSFAALAQSSGEGEFDTVVERYVAEGLRSNLALQGQSLEVERAAQALAAARARFLPEVSLQARYSRDIEREADAFARDWLLQRGIDPAHFDHIMCRLSESMGGQLYPAAEQIHPQVCERGWGNRHRRMRDRR